MIIFKVRYIIFTDADVPFHSAWCPKIKNSTFSFGFGCVHLWSQGFVDVSDMGESNQCFTEDGNGET